MEMLYVYKIITIFLTIIPLIGLGVLLVITKHQTLRSGRIVSESSAVSSGITIIVVGILLLIYLIIDWDNDKTIKEKMNELEDTKLSKADAIKLVACLIFVVSITYIGRMIVFDSCAESIIMKTFANLVSIFFIVFVAFRMSKKKNK